MVKGKVIYNFDGVVTLVTGAARGIGHVLLHRYLESGSFVIAVDRDPIEINGISRAQENKIIPIKADISKPEDVKRIINQVMKRHDSLDVLINNAAVAPHTSLLEETPELWDRVYSINCKGTFMMTQAAAKLMINKGNGGRIINFSSGVSRRGSPGTAAYASSRAAVEAFTRVAAIELSPYNILVNTVSPGLIDTQPRPLPKEMRKRLEKRIPLLPLARPGDPNEVVELVLFLSSEASSYINGEVIMVDGGSNIGSRPNLPIIDDDPRYFWLREKRDK
jgi:NAD(P)-dependent dehydrogenase (short-subunit alcohol dehydrogenase family)